MVRAGNIEFSDSSQSLYFRSEETVSQILQVTLFIDGSFIRGGQVDGSFGSLEGNDGVYLFVLQAVRDKPVITFQDIGRLIPDLLFDLLLSAFIFSRNILQRIELGVERILVYERNPSGCIVYPIDSCGFL